MMCRCSRGESGEDLDESQRVGSLLSELILLGISVLRKMRIGFFGRVMMKSE